MSKFVKIIAVSLVCILVFATCADAGILSKAKSWLSGEVLALLASGVLALLGGMFGAAFRKVSRTFKEIGDFLATLGSALDDQRITREELADIIKEGKEIFGVWR